MKKIRKKIFSTTPSVVKKGMAAMLCMVMMGLFLVGGCKKDNEKKPPIEDEYPIDIPFTPYFVRCYLSFMTEDCENLKVSIINSKEEFESCRDCIGEQYYILFSEVDFSKYSLLFTRSSMRSDMDFINNKNFQQLSNGDYLWNIDYFHRDNDAGGYWISIIKTEKIEKNSNIYLDFDTIASGFPDNYLMEICTFDYALPEPCQWKNVNDNEIIIVDYNNPLKNYVTCDNLDRPTSAAMWITKISVPKSIKTISKKLLYSKGKYELHLEVDLIHNSPPEERVIAFSFFGVLMNYADFELNVNVNE